MDVEVVEATVALVGWVLVTTAGVPWAVTTEVWGVVAGVVSVVGGWGVEDGLGSVVGSEGVLLCTGLEGGDCGVEEGATGVELGVVITEDGVEEGVVVESTMVVGGCAEVVAGAVENEKKRWSVIVR